MNSNIYRCGWCGCPTNEIGQNLEEKTQKRVGNIITNYGDGRTKKTHGDCCRRNYETTNLK